MTAFLFLTLVFIIFGKILTDGNGLLQWRNKGDLLLYNYLLRAKVHYETCIADPDEESCGESRGKPSGTGT